ncbi:MAG: hypothetical protein WCA89_18690, partial [Terracidiphilus sp.]
TEVRASNSSFAPGRAPIWAKVRFMGSRITQIGPQAFAAGRPPKRRFVHFLDYAQYLSIFSYFLFWSTRHNPILTLLFSTTIKSFPAFRENGNQPASTKPSRASLSWD